MNKTIYKFFWVKTNSFNDRAGLHLGRHIFGNNSPASIARELFKPSTDSASLLVSMKKNYLIWVWAFVLVTPQRGHVFEFLNNFGGPSAPIQWAIFWLKLFVETRRSAASIEPLIDLLACLEPKSWPKKPILPPNQKIAENVLSFPLAASVITITRR